MRAEWKNSSRTGSRRRALTVAPLGILVVGGLLGACSSSPSPSASGNTTTTAAGSSTSAPAGSSTTAPSGSGTSTAAALNALSSRLAGAQTKTFKAVYATSGSGTPQTITFEQAPPKSAIITSSGSVIDTGSQTLFCSTSNGKSTCVASSGASPLAALTALFDPQQVLNTLKSFDGLVAAHVAGVSVHSSTRTVAGQNANCVTVSSAQSAGGTWCVTDTGLLAYSQAGSNTVTLTSYSATPNAADFSPPAGATVETLPTGVSIP